MSRCYPYPPPGYEKKAYVEPPLSPKGAQKEKHKHKDKKKKRRKDKETNGDSKPHDKDKRSKSNHQSGHVEGMSNLANGVHSEDMPNLVNGILTRSEAGHENAIQILQASRTGERMLADAVLDTNRKGLELNCMVDQAPMVSPSFRASTSGNGAAASDQVWPPPSIGVSEIEDELNRKRRVEFMPHVEQAWSAVDDQEWLFVRDNQLQIGPKEMEKPESAAQVFANAIFLPSVGIYALPYVVVDL